MMQEPGLGSRSLPREHTFRRTLALRRVEELGSDLLAAGVEADVGHHGTVRLHAPRLRSLERAKASWPDMCRSRYMLHLDGYSYSASLKYRLACGAVVLRVVGAIAVGRKSVAPIEWWEAATPLRPHEEYVQIDANLSNLMPEVRRLQREPHLSRRISDAAASYAQKAIGPAAISSYMDALLSEYVKLFGKWARVCGRSTGTIHRVSEVDARREACAEARETRQRAESAEHRGLRPSLVCRTVALGAAGRKPSAHELRRGVSVAGA